MQNRKQVNKDKDVLKFALSFHAFPKIPNETHTQEKFSFQHYHQFKLILFFVFCSKNETKIPKNIKFKMCHENKLPRNPKVPQRACKTYNIV